MNRFLPLCSWKIINRRLVHVLVHLNVGRTCISKDKLERFWLSFSLSFSFSFLKHLSKSVYITFTVWVHSLRQPLVLATRFPFYRPISSWNKRERRIARLIQLAMPQLWYQQKELRRTVKEDKKMLNLLNTTITVIRFSNRN